MAESVLRRLKVPHVFTLLTGVILLCSLLTCVLPAGHYQREKRTVGGSTAFSRVFAAGEPDSASSSA